MKNLKKLLLTAVAITASSAAFTVFAVKPQVIKLDNGPEITLYTPEKPVGAAVLICPGGGYVKKCIDKEGYLFAPFFNEKGITLAVLDYRLPAGNPSLPTGDAVAGLRYLHDNADALHLDKNKIGIMGGSAGGHLAAQTAVSAPKDVAPKFQILLYPAVSMVDMSLAHRGSRERLLGDKADDRETMIAYSPNLLVTPETAQAFIILTADDSIVDPENSLSYARALGSNGVACELHMFAHGPHGFGANEIPFRKVWLDALSRWLDTNVLSE